MELSLDVDIRMYCVGLVEKLVEEGTEIMKGEVPVKTGDLRNSIHNERTGATTWFIGSTNDHAYYVENGRGPVLPGAITGRGGRKKALYWPELSHPVMRAGPAKANDFVGRTAAQIDGRELN